MSGDMSEKTTANGHHAADERTVRCRVVVVSDTRTLQTDEGGRLIAERLDAAGHRVVDRRVVVDDIKEIAWQVRAATEDFDTDVVILTGGTGVTARDLTPEAVEPMLDRFLPGFGEAFRRISFEEVGAHGLLSRAFAGFIGHCAVFALPGSKKACATAMDRLIVPMLPHTVAMARGSTRLR